MIYSQITRKFACYSQITRKSLANGLHFILNLNYEYSDY